MASEVDISNLALSHLGDDASVSSIDPPEGSAQAEHCARFYPMARDAAIQSADWSFAARRVLLAELVSESDQWDYCYAKPTDALVIRAILPQDASGDDPAYQQEYAIEVNSAGVEVIYTDQPLAIAKYTKRITDPGVFPPMVVQGISWLLASMVAGPLIKGDAGRAAALNCSKMSVGWLGKAMEVDKNQRKTSRDFKPSWIEAR
jgi:hypothetical protein